jgi:hypothetical protein
MENEEIHKQALKTLRRHEKRWAGRVLGITFIGLFGIFLIFTGTAPGPGWRTDIVMVFALIMSIGLIYAMYKETYRHQKAVRNYIYNMVRADEQKKFQEEVTKKFECLLEISHDD